MSRRLLVVAMDGPAGSGKSTVARKLAEALGWRLLDTGAMYRLVALAGLRRGVDLADRQALAAIARELRPEFDGNRVILDGEDVSAEIRTPRVTAATKHAADNPEVRKLLARWQRQFAETRGPVVAEGRDQGTVVFPDATLKIFLTASVDERARRRHDEFLRRGESLPLDEVREAIRARDREDELREIAPLKPAEGAVILDTTGMPPEDVVETLRNLVLETLRRAGLDLESQQTA